MMTIMEPMMYCAVGEVKMLCKAIMTDSNNKGVTIRRKTR